ncbi:KilA-N domain-containing protein [Neolewinella aurantiaca]|uniref:KilA-N domain-containing protein n=1 Tax=Neolewinella aurantiaca TaxID=2602767 RepID=A0A5C7F9J1_9BACT|nr:KilA-N domain-containing protein [Neolewinella aurantiaca]TXF82282.1 KilA-N domain-containing protein [Neolewinella aurantiaca]
MPDIKRFEYDGKVVTFQLEEGASFVNATEMAKPFGKQPKDFLRTAGTKAFILAPTPTRELRCCLRRSHGGWASENATRFGLQALRR